MIPLIGAENGTERLFNSIVWLNAQFYSPDMRSSRFIQHFYCHFTPNLRIDKNKQINANNVNMAMKKSNFDCISVLILFSYNEMGSRNAIYS